jgi:methylenetetrahydrofolate reductase (NADPH)
LYIRDVFKQKKAVVSFEIFPPKQNSSINVIYDTIDALAPLRPDYISVTYGAGGSTSKTTVDIASIIENKYHINALAHLTCFTSSKADMDQILTDLDNKNVSNILALRGDEPKDMENKGLDTRDFQYASDLANYIKENYSFCLGGACYPEGHPENTSLEQDVKNLKEKVEAGVSFLVTQLFFDNEMFYRFKDIAEKTGINVPIQAGIMPVTNRKQIERIVELTNATVPPKLIKILDKFEHNSEAIKDAGIAYATEQIIELLANDIEGVHIYTMNRPQVAKDLVRNLESLFYAVNK